MIYVVSEWCKIYCVHFGKLPTQDEFTKRMNYDMSHESVKYKSDSYSYSLHMSISKFQENTLKRLEKLAMLEQWRKIKAALGFPIGCERIIAAMA